MSTSFFCLWSWATRDVLRRPGEALLSALALASLITLLGVGLLATQGLSASAREVLEPGPSLVVRRLGPGGWAPMPATALEKALGVRGVTRALARSWGVVRWQEQGVTVLASEPGAMSAVAKAPKGMAMSLGGDLEARGASRGGSQVSRGQAIIGPGIDLRAGDAIVLEGARSLNLRVVEQLAPDAGLVAHDLVFVAPADAKAILGLAPSEVSDLALWVFHESEVDAIRPDLQRAFPFPVRITSAREASGALLSRLQRRAGLGVTTLIPSLLAMILLALAVARSQSAARRDVGLLKALGWRSADIVRLHFLRALVIALPALALGWGLAYGLVFLSGLQWLGALLLGWDGAAPWLTIEPSGALVTLLEVGALVLGPWLAAFVLPAARAAGVDAEQWLREEGAP